MVQHKAEVPPIFLAYSCVSVEGVRILLIQVVSSVVQALRDHSALDTVQPMHNGWCIYLCTITDRVKLVNSGLTLASQYIQLCSEQRETRKPMVKLMFKDLPLHMVSNLEVLDAVKEVCEPTSEVSYCSMWFNGQLTNIRNGDCFCYIESDSLDKFSDTIQVGQFHARIFKPKAQMTCKRCGKEGHHASDTECPARSLLEVSESVEVFRGGKYQLSNLHKCPEGCPEGNKVFPLSEHRYQFSKLKAHDMIEEAFDLLEEPDPFKVMQKAKEVVPDIEASAEWKASAVSEMMESNWMKFQACSHVREKLLLSRITITEVTADCFWGIGLTMEQNSQCLPEFGPGQNQMGKVLINLRLKFQQDIDRDSADTTKCKAESPLMSESSKKSGYG